MEKKSVPGKNYDGFPMFFVIPWAQSLIKVDVHPVLVPESLYPLSFYSIILEKKK
jgi:hypothetical protein